MGELHGWTLMTSMKLKIENEIDHKGNKWMKLMTRLSHMIWHGFFLRCIFSCNLSRGWKQRISHKKFTYWWSWQYWWSSQLWALFFFLFSFLFNFVISRIWWISHKIIKIQDFLSGYKDFHLVFVNCQIVWKCFSKYHRVQGKRLWRKKEHKKKSWKLSCQFFQYFHV
jgi:hypothetical protein